MAINWTKLGSVAAVVGTLGATIAWADGYLSKRFTEQGTFQQFQGVTAQELTQIKLQVQQNHNGTLRQIYETKIEGVDDELAIIQFKQRKGTSTDVDEFRHGQLVQKRQRLEAKMGALK
jgi:hypothetical protein